MGAGEDHLPDLRDAVDALRTFASTDPNVAKSGEQSRIIHEVVRRLERLAKQFADLMQLNGTISSRGAAAIHFDQDADELVASFGDQVLRVQLRRADPNTPIRVQPVADGAAWDSGKQDPAADEQLEALRTDLEAQVEAFYQNAHSVLKLLKRVDGLPKIKCDAVSRVRNELIEHPHEGDMYTFGVGSSGPRLRPGYQQEPKYLDEGLVPNTRDFVQAIVGGCEAASTGR